MMRAFFSQLDGHDRRRCLRPVTGGERNVVKGSRGVIQRGRKDTSRLTTVPIAGTLRVDSDRRPDEKVKRRCARNSTFLEREGNRDAMAAIAQWG